MAFDYDKIKSRAEEGNFWTSYSDLFMVLSVVFLLLYVVASLRSGTFSIQKSLEYRQIAQRADDLEEQIRVYNTLRDEELSHTTEEEQEVYRKLMSRLELLQDEARDEKERLRQQAKENEEKEFALNKYQQLVRNIINTNVLAKAQIQRRDETITGLNQEVQAKRKAIEENERQIREANQALESRIAELRREQQKRKTSKAILEKRIADLKTRSNAEIRKLEEQSQKQRTELIAKLEATKLGYEMQMKKLETDAQSRLEKERAAFEENLRKQKLSAREKQRRLAKFQSEAERKEREMQKEIAQLGSKIQHSEQQLKQAQETQQRYVASIQNLESQNQKVSRELAKAREKEEARERIIREIRNNFQKAGIKAKVDGKTGDVVLTFDDEYFDTGSSHLKPGMTSKLQKFIPIYTKSLFSNPRLAEKIENVEIVGFASPTYKGRYVNPKSLHLKDREAVNYNLNLSFKRANSIFKYIFDKSNLRYQHQQDLLPIVKVVGRGYLPEGTSGDEIPEGMPEDEFCRVYRCNQAQKVEIKFKLKD